MGITLVSEFEIMRLAEAIVFDSDCTREDIYKLIITLDDLVAEYEFTEKLRDRFAEVLAEEDGAS